MGGGPSTPSHKVSKSEENGIDPDLGNSWVCSACKFPIFSTPFETKQHGNKHHFLHDQCANLPNKLKGHPFHRFKPLTLKEKWDSDSTESCDRCSEKCGSMWYQCAYSSCDLRLDLFCSMQVEMVHRSHEHRLTPIRSPASFTCGACETEHEGLLSSPSYMCTACDFWLHHDCASAPNAVKLLQHQHSLFLTYDPIATTTTYTCSCAICGEDLNRTGAYVCIKCSYYVHIRCATSDPQSFQPVLIRDAKFADLLHLPMPDEVSNMVQYMLENTSASANDEKKEEEEEDTDDDDDDDDNNDDKEDEEEGDAEEKDGHDRRLHKHPLILHEEKEDDDSDDDDDGTGHSKLVCNACVQLISPPFYTCSDCPNFLLHVSCANLPSKIRHPFHKEHALFLSTKPPKSEMSNIGFECDGCELESNGFAYSCKSKSCEFNLDVFCALMPPSITHASHGKSHILYMSSNSHDCSCCSLELRDAMYYECSNCRHLKLHARCALLPSSVTHSYDVHPLKLITTSSTQGRHEFCEVCEEDMEEKGWCYACRECEQWFHIRCIPFLNPLSRIKLGDSVSFKLHECPLTIVRESTLMGYRCNDCEGEFSKEKYPSKLRISYECSKCCYRIHDSCAEFRNLILN